MDLCQKIYKTPGQITLGIILKIISLFRKRIPQNRSNIWFHEFFGKDLLKFSILYEKYLRSFCNNEDDVISVVREDDLFSVCLEDSDTVCLSNSSISSFKNLASWGCFWCSCCLLCSKSDSLFVCSKTWSDLLESQHINSFEDFEVFNEVAAIVLGFSISRNVFDPPLFVLSSSMHILGGSFSVFCFLSDAKKNSGIQY